MLFREVVDLISISTNENEVGDPVRSETSRQIFANKKSVRQSEFYQAAMTDLRPEIMFEVRSSDYQEEREVRWQERSYDVIRVSSNNDEIAQLICQGKTGDA